MEIREVQLRHFGRFSGERVSFGSGINVIAGKNETGKTTIHAFIKAMLFGIEKQRGKAGKRDEYFLRDPWQSPGCFDGMMRIESDGKRFRIERNFNRHDKSVTLVCETDGEEMDPERGDLEMLLDGMTESTFCNTIFIPQNKWETDAGLADELKNFMTNYQMGGDEDIDLAAAVEQLDKEQKIIQRKEREQKKKYAVLKTQIDQKADYIKEEMEELQRKLAEKKVILGERQEETKVYPDREIYEEKVQRQPDVSIISGMLLILGVFLFLTGLVGSILFHSSRYVILYVGMLVAGILVFAGVQLWKKGHQEEWEEAEEEDLQEEEIEELPEEETYGRTLWECEKLQDDLEEKKIRLLNLEQEYDEIRSDLELQKRLQEQSQALEKAKTVIQEMGRQYYKSFGKEFNEMASEILSEITGGKYRRITLNDQMEIRIFTEDKVLQIDQVSRGTMHQIYFALRMAAGKVLWKDISMPVILDDAFAMFDKERLEMALRWLYHSQRQVILFSCHDREKQLIEKIKREEEKKL